MKGAAMFRLGAAAVILLLGCSTSADKKLGDPPSGSGIDEPGGGSGTGTPGGSGKGGGADPVSGNESGAAGPDNTFDHPHDAPPEKPKMPEGNPIPDEVLARLHGMGKLSYDALGKLLSGLGVNMASTTADTAGRIYRDGAAALGAPQYGGRIPEATTPSTASLAKQFDIFTAAAPEILANIGKSSRCPNVVLVQNNQLTQDGISCLIGRPARQEHVTLANQLVAQASTPEIGQRIATAALLEAAHTAE